MVIDNALEEGLIGEVGGSAVCGLIDSMGALRIVDLGHS